MGRASTFAARCADEAGAADGQDSEAVDRLQRIAADSAAEERRAAGIDVIARQVASNLAREADRLAEAAAEVANRAEEVDDGEVDDGLLRTGTQAETDRAGLEALVEVQLETARRKAARAHSEALEAITAAGVELAEALRAESQDTAASEAATRTTAHRGVGRGTRTPPLASRGRGVGTTPRGAGAELSSAAARIATQAVRERVSAAQLGRMAAAAQMLLAEAALGAAEARRQQTRADPPETLAVSAERRGGAAPEAAEGGGAGSGDRG